MLLTHGKKEYIICWTFALLVHSILLFLKFNLTSPVSHVKLSPIVEIDYIIPEEALPISTPMVKKTKKTKGFFAIIKNIFKREEKPTEQPSVEKIKNETIPTKIGINKKLVDKSKNLPKRRFKDITASLSKEDRLVDTAETKIDEKISTIPTEEGNKPLKNKIYTIAKKDVSFKVYDTQNIIKPEEDIVPINIGKKTSKSIFASPVLKEKKRKILSDSNLLESKSSSNQIQEGLRSSSPNQTIVEGSSQIISEGTNNTSASNGTGAVSSGKATGSSSYTASGTGRSLFYFPGATQRTKAFTSSSTGGAEIEKAEETVFQKRKKAIYQITGQLSNRKVLKKVLPTYPSWAEKQGIEVYCSVHITVLSNGEVKDNLYIWKTSGYPRIDKLSIETLRKWKFAPLEKNSYGKEEWGIITFYFSLK